MLRCLFYIIGGYVGEFGLDADLGWLHTAQFRIPFYYWKNLLDERRDVFFGYSGSSELTAATIKRYLLSLGAKVLDWQTDFIPGRTILDQIEQAAAHSIGGIFLFTRDDDLVDHGQRDKARRGEHVMSRTKAFISYSHQDKEWRDQLMTHLAVLERREWLHVWTDTRINVGETWKTEIDNALRESRVAVLLISPAFLASKFIWQEEIWRIMEHRKDGMLVLPLIARPCAWQFEPDLAQLQARPADGRPLSIGSNAQIDLDLTAFAYELALHLQPRSTHLAARSWEMAEQFRHSRPPSDRSATDHPSPKHSNGLELLPFLNEPLPLSWTGRYLPSQKIRLTILTASQEQVQGIITYLNDGTVTRLDGRIAGDQRHIASDNIWSRINNVDLYQVKFAIEFRETDYEHKGAKRVDFNGKYLALVTNQAMVGVWVQGDSIIGHFFLEIGESANSA